MNKVAKRHLMFCAVLLFIALACTCVFSSVMAHYSVTKTATAFAKVNPTVYTVYWLVDFDDNSEYTIVAEGTTTNPATEVNKPADPIKEDTAQYDYEFKQWNKTVEGTVITYKAEFTATLRSYTVTWVVDGASTAETYEYGATPSFKGSTDKAATAQYTYTFSGWSPALDTVTGAATYTAQYSTTVNKYTVTFKNYDGTDLQTQDVEYGVTPSYTGATPTKPSNHTNHIDYTFSGWSPSVTSVTGDATYTAQFLETPYTAPEYITYCHDHMYYLDANKNKTGEEAFPEGLSGTWNNIATIDVDSNIAYLQQYGWIAFNAKDKDSFELGYIIEGINGGEPVYSKDHVGVTESSLLGILQNTMNPAPKCATRFKTYLDISKLPVGTYTVQFVIKLYGESDYHEVNKFTLKISHYYTVTYEYKYNVIDRAADGGVTNVRILTDTSHTERVPHGSVPPNYKIPDNHTRAGMTFTGWSNMDPVTSDRTCVAQYTNQTYNSGGSIDLRRDFRFAAWFDHIYCGSNHVAGVFSRHNVNARVAQQYDGWSTDSTRIIILDGWLASMLGQSELIWTFGTNPANSSEVAGPWYLCTDGFYESSDAPVLAAATDLMRKTDDPAEANKTFDINNENGRFRSVKIDLNAYAGQTVNIIVAARGTDGRAVTILELTNLYVAP